MLAGWRDAVAGAPDELSTAGVHLVAAGRPRAARAAARARRTSASPACGRATRPRASAPRGALRELATPLLDMSGPMSVPRLPALAGPVLPGRAAPLLEGALPRRALRRRDRRHGRLVGRRPSSETLVIIRHCGGRDRARRRRGDRVRRPQLGVDAEHRLDLGRPRRRRRATSPTRARSGTPCTASRTARRTSTSPACSRRATPAVRASYGANHARLARIKARLRPGQPLPAQPEHPPRGLASNTTRCGEAANTTGIGGGPTHRRRAHPVEMPHHG